MKRSALAGLCALLAACHSQSQQLGPPSKKFLSSLSPFEVEEAARAELIARGFQISANRINRGYVGATRKGRGSENSRFITCKDGLGAEGDFNNATPSLVTEVRVFVSATQRQTDTVGKSDVSVSASVVATFVDTPAGVKPENNGMCVSSGEIEARLLGILDR